ncbi:MAG: DNA repair protein RecO, partial [Gaiellaceae bacterium]
LEAVLQLFAESDPSVRAFGALVRFLEVLGGEEPPDGEPSTDPLALSFQYKLLWLAGLAPHLDSCTSCGEAGALSAFATAAGGAVCENCRDAAAVSVSGEALGGIRGLLESPLSDARALAPRPAALREMLWLLQEIHTYHGGFRLKTLAG